MLTMGWMRIPTASPVCRLTASHRSHHLSHRQPQLQGLPLHLEVIVPQLVGVHAPGKPSSAGLLVRVPGQLHLGVLQRLGVEVWGRVASTDLDDEAVSSRPTCGKGPSMQHHCCRCNGSRARCRAG